MEQLDVRQPAVELETTLFFQCRNQPRVGERLCPSPLPMPIPSTPLSQHIAETVQQVGESVEDPEEEEEQMMLVTTVAPGPRSEGCLLVGARREIHPSSPEWSTPTGRELIAQGVKTETDTLICDKRALVPLSLEESALVPKERIVPSRMVWWQNVMMKGTDL